MLTTALDLEVVDQFAELTGTELAFIDAGTRPRAFRQELRSNAVYRLAGGLGS